MEAVKFARDLKYLALKKLLNKTTDYYAPEHKCCIQWNDPELAIDWHYHDEPVLSDKDKQGVNFKDAEYFNEN